MVHPRALVTTIPGSLKPDSRDLETETGHLEMRREYIGYMVHWKRDYTRMPRSLVAPSRGAGGYIYIYTFIYTYTYTYIYIHSWARYIDELKRQLHQAQDKAMQRRRT